VSRRDRILTAALLLGGTAALIGVVMAAGQLCPAPTAGDPCLEADRNRLIVLGLAAGGVFALMTGAAFAVDFLAHRRIVYLGSWARAVRRGGLTALTLAALAGLRLADALTGFSAIVVVALALAVEWLASRRLDGP
jgi:hypothetical protein